MAPAFETGGTPARTGAAATGAADGRGEGVPSNKGTGGSDRAGVPFPIEVGRRVCVGSPALGAPMSLPCGYGEVGTVPCGYGGGDLRGGNGSELRTGSTFKLLKARDAAAA